MIFKDRNEAAKLLIPYLNKYRNEDCVVLAVPRGGVPIAYLMVKLYGFPLDLLMAKKIGHPANPEFAIGAVTLEDHIITEEGVSLSYIDREVDRIRKSLQERYELFMGKRELIPIEDKVVIIVDDGVATGNTILTSIKMLRKKRPKKIIVAIPVAPQQTMEKLKRQVDDLICLSTPEPFIGVGQHYIEFRQVSDNTVIELLNDVNGITSQNSAHESG